ncbi:MAG: alpha/beta fold hydrolase [Desulfobacteraceae bacterium]|jgi:alpha-beta hydrolase superfamily lysophospholipase
MLVAQPARAQRHEKVRFTSADGLALQGCLHLPAVRRPPVVIGCHGLFSSGESGKQQTLAQDCNRRGIAFLRFDHRGCGASEGDFKAVTSLAGRMRDLAAAAALLSARTDLAPRVGLFGSSMGGTVCLAMAARLNVAAVVTLAAPVRSQPVLAAIARSAERERVAERLNPENLHFDIAAQIDGIHSLLLFHGDADAVVPVASAREIYARAAEPKAMRIFRRGDHRMSAPGDQAVFQQEAADWFARYLVG